MHKLKNERGLITVEATISLTAFMFALITVLTIINICIVQAKMSCAINATAKEISQYSYLYSLTGLNESHKDLVEEGKKDTEGVTKILKDINEVFNEVENLGQTGKQTPENIEEILDAWPDLSGSMDSIGEKGKSIYSEIEDIAKDPKNLMFGIVKMAASEGFDLVKSRLIAAPLSKALVQKHLVNDEDGNVNAYLKSLGVVPSATGSYIDGLDFSHSQFFPKGSSEIKVCVEYDVKVIALLPIDFSFHFTQTAVTHGWLTGENSHKSKEDVKVEYVDNNTLWTEATIDERSSYIRHMVIADLMDEGYSKTSGLTDVQLYNVQTKEFAMIASMNPLWSATDEDPKTLADLNDEALKTTIERLCGKAASTTDGLRKVTTKEEVSGTTTKPEHDCTGASTKIILVIPEDEGLKERMEQIVSGAKKHGVTVEIVPSFGKGARATAAVAEKEDRGE